MALFRGIQADFVLVHDFQDGPLEYDVQCQSVLPILPEAGKPKPSFSCHRPHLEMRVGKHVTMSVAFLQLVSQPQDRLHPHLCAKIPVKRTRGSTLITYRFPLMHNIELGVK